MPSKSRRDVVQLLKGYETNDQRRAEAEGGARIDYGFLWDRLGLTRE